MTRGGRTLPIALGALLATLVAAPAQASFGSCRALPGAQCDRVAVPLDRSGVVAGEIGLHVVRLKARRPTDAALVYLSGGPGGAGVAEFAGALMDRPIRRLRSRYHLATFDQRGTGRSGLLRCRAMERDPRLRSTRAGERCAAALGERRAFFTTRETVEDLEAVRVALEVERLILYGVSYGTKVALAYSRAYPSHVERLVLDSVVDPDDADAFGIEPYQALPGTLRGLCPARCRGVTDDPVADLAALTERLRARSMPRVTPLRVSDLLFDADYAPELRAGVPAAVRSALEHRNPRPLARLIRTGRALASTGSPRDFSAARYATTCEETPLPWDRGTPFERRLEEARARAAALGADALRPFDFEVLRADEIDLCLRWPEAAAAPVLRGDARPDIPALLLQGGEDLRTPPSTSQRVAQGLPRAERVVVPGVGHAVLASDPSGCARRMLSRWLRARSVADRCPRVPTGVPPVGVVPRRLRDVVPAPGLHGRLGRTVAGISITLEDLAFLLSPALAVRPTDDGLAGGRLRIDARHLGLERFAAMRGLWLDGEVRPNGLLTLRVGGSQARHGRVVVSRGGRLRGRLGGRRVRARLGAGRGGSGAAAAAIARAVRR